MTKYLITVSTATRRGRTSLHTFGKYLEAEHLGWFPETHASRKQMKQRAPLPGSRLPSQWPPPERRAVGTPYYRPLAAEKLVKLADGVDIPGASLTVILDALRSGDRHKLDLGDLNLVISELGSCITKLAGLSDEERRHAVPALYTEILRRCTRL